MHLNLQRQLDDVRWNHANQDEVLFTYISSNFYVVACTSVKSNEVLIFDIGYISSKPVEVLRTRRTLSVLGSEVYKGLCEIAFTTTDNSRAVLLGLSDFLEISIFETHVGLQGSSRLIASDTHGVVNIWDKRKSPLPSLELITGSRSTLNTIQLHVDNQAGLPPLVSFKLASKLAKIGSLKAQSDIVPKEIHSIDLDPSCPYQLAFHLDDGWSGVLDIYNLRVTHVHCPPPAWLNGASISTDLLYLRKPSWLPTSSIYAVGSSYDCGIHILDFYPDTSSPSHVDYREDVESLSKMNHQRKKNIFVPLSEGVTTCASHPLNGTIIAGTKVSLLF
ncbi:hypothetical protein Gohar_010922 [Gossypium harknessii]|uniref:Transducin/WD40 repeat-like superfamily protein n=1 Tax=Gossypium harknessii TaxID=34285 RepID=A0A7J9GTS2_9ROSI|nr:hypothetical protein [Gossypium harknessii]